MHVLRAVLCATCSVVSEVSHLFNVVTNLKVKELNIRSNITVTVSLSQVFMTVITIVILQKSSKNQVNPCVLLLQWYWSMCIYSNTVIYLPGLICF